jgi:hypothetical protein
MNERDKELAKQAWTENDWDGHVDIPKLIQLVRADERSNIRPQSSMAYQEGMEVANRAATASWTLMCKKMVEFEREACAKLCDDLDDDLPDGLAGWQYGEAIRARGNI